MDVKQHNVFEVLMQLGNISKLATKLAQSSSETCNIVYYISGKGWIKVNTRTLYRWLATYTEIVHAYNLRESIIQITRRQNIRESKFQTCVDCLQIESYVNYITCNIYLGNILRDDSLTPKLFWV